MFTGLFNGGEGEIRTLEPLLTVTRFPIARARPTTRLLRMEHSVVSSECPVIIAYLLKKIKRFFIFSNIWDHPAVSLCETQRSRGLGWGEAPLGEGAVSGAD